VDEELKRLRKKYLDGMKVNIKGEIRQDGKDKEDIDLLDLMYHEPTTIFLREDY
jgi:hypothetical protein